MDHLEKSVLNVVNSHELFHFVSNQKVTLSIPIRLRKSNLKIVNSIIVDLNQVNHLFISKDQIKAQLNLHVVHFIMMMLQNHVKLFIFKRRMLFLMNVFLHDVKKIQLNLILQLAHQKQENSNL